MIGIFILILFLNFIIFLIKTAVNFCPIHITQSDKYFKNPKEFDPLRWSSERSAEIHPYAALPFGYGPRMCLGRRISEQEIYVTIIRVMNFSFYVFF
jgi:cytochrome P450